MNRSHTAQAGGSPGSHSHADQPNWRPAVTADEYLNNCSEGLEVYSERRMAKLMGVPRFSCGGAYRKQQSHLNYSKSCSKPSAARRSWPPSALCSLAQIWPWKKEHCPHCGEVRSVKARFSKQHELILRDWFKRHDRPTHRHYPEECHGRIAHHRRRMEGL